MTPGNSVLLTYNLPPGTYVLLCYASDPNNGMQHDLMGIHKVITLN